MELSPDDIVGYRFKQSLRGYSIEEVDELLDRLADQVERMAAELAVARQKAQEAEAQTAAIRETEATLQRTLVVAQQAAERNLADAAAQAEATLATASADAERLRREAEEDIARRRSEAEAGAARLLEQAQQLARREVEAARSRVEQAAARHAEVLAGVASHRDALRGHLAALEELALDPPPAPRADLVAGELPTDPDAPGGAPTGDLGDDPGDPGDGGGTSEHDRGGAGVGVDAGPEVAPAGPEGTAPLTVRVHEGRGDTASHAAPLGSEARDGD